MTIKKANFERNWLFLWYKVQPSEIIKINAVLINLKSIYNYPILITQFSLLNSQYSVLNSHYSILNYRK